MGRSDSKCMTEHSGRCVKELEILRHFQTWSCLYKAWSYSRSREEPEEIRARQHRSVGRRDVCCLRVCLRVCAVRCDRAIAILEHLEVVACSALCIRRAWRARNWRAHPTLCIRRAWRPLLVLARSKQQINILYTCIRVT